MIRHRVVAAVLCSALVALSPALHAAPRLPSINVAWLPAAADADIDRAFAQAGSVLA